MFFSFQKNKRMSEVDKLIQNPLAAVQRCFEQAVNGNSGKVPAGDWGVQQLVKEAVAQVGLQNVRNSGQAAINMLTTFLFLVPAGPIPVKNSSSKRQNRSKHPGSLPWYDPGHVRP
jgi:hypothetical protein